MDGAANAEVRPRLAVWLFAVAATIAVLVVVGGITRLTGSGLSITRWDLVRGTLPPIGETAWQAAFDAYRESPQYRLVNAHFGLADFRQIFWWEWVHRLLGRVLVPMLLLPWIAWRLQIPRWLHCRLVLIVTLVVLQGALGWFMVASGLIDVPQVSHFRLAAHLSTALITFVVVVWTGLELARGRRNALSIGPRMAILAGLLLAQIVWGAFVAGLDAGAIHPTWPLISGHWVPRWAFERGWPWAITHHPTAVQFVHRTNALLVVALGLATAAQRLVRREEVVASALLGLLLVGQFGLGVATVIHFARHPIALGSSHQSLALLIVAVSVVLAHGTAQPVATTVARSKRSGGKSDAELHASIRV